MKLIAPDYFEKFKCLADKCVHTCCKGWEIDIDEKTMSFYETVEGKLGERLKKGIEKDEFGTPHFVLDRDERCPFLNKTGLCDIYSELGEACLCQICYDHPRFRDFYEDRTEIGLGLCCEAVGRLIFEREEKTALVVLDDDGKEESISEKTKEMYALRDKVFSAVQNREKTIPERIEDMLSLIGEAYTPKTPQEQFDLYSSLERLSEERDEAYKKILTLSEGDVKDVLAEKETAFEQLLYYFVFRHMADGVDDGKYKERLLFCADSTYFVASLCAAAKKEKGSLTLDDLTEYSRLFSSEVEYSDLNMEFFI